MPQIIITTDGHGGTDANVYRERISPADFETETASLKLIERIGWALSDADELEHRLEPVPGEDGSGLPRAA
jgi:hypothetical protein